MTQLVPTPSNLDATTKAFLDKYQPLSDAASTFIGPTKNDLFDSAGFCYVDYPCFSVEEAAVATVDSTPAITQTQMAGLLDNITANSTVTFGQSATDEISGMQISSNGAVLEIISAPAMWPSDAMAGVAFDLFKLQGGDSSSNAIRAFLAATDGAPNPMIALCLYPEAANRAAVSDFCLGMDLVGGSSGAKVKRFSFAGVLGNFCSNHNVPLLCTDA
jgi:hypothetical protein